MEQQTKEQRVHHVFEKIYNNYDTMNSVISFDMHKVWRKDVMEKMHVQDKTTALDVCCGTGDWSISLAQAVGSEGKVYGLDFSDNMLSVAKQKQNQYKLDNLVFKHGNAMELPFENNSFDYVTIGFGLRNVPDYETVLKEIYRVLKPGGLAVCLETSQPSLPVYRQGYYLYFHYVMPLFGKLFAKSYKEYAWLHESAKNFPDKNTLTQMFFNAGFSFVDVKSYTGGVAAMHMGHKSI